jgi:hypothetical protein
LRLSEKHQKLGKFETKYPTILVRKKTLCIIDSFWLNSLIEGFAAYLQKYTKPTINVLKFVRQQKGNERVVMDIRVVRQ